jgi:beta-1,2-mannobiose phosphorylase / 1,2-beta-oligomannan phosphorylase
MILTATVHPTNSDDRFHLLRRGVVLTPDPANPYEAGGVLNPAATLHDGLTYILYRAVAVNPHNYSRILIATCSLLPTGNINVTRFHKVALEPEEAYELWADGNGGGVEDPRITKLNNFYYMTYVAYGTVDGITAPRIAIAHSRDLIRWQRMGLIRFSPLEVVDGDHVMSFNLNDVPNKDAVLFPKLINGRYCMLHRPMFDPATGLLQSIWMSWSDDLLNWTDHRLVLAPELTWERVKVGAGTPPILTEEGWLVFYHGVEGAGETDPDRRYHAGVLMLDLDNPGKILYRSPRPVLSPESAEETTGVVNNVVFPCGAVVSPSGQIEVYYGMGDHAIGLATTRLPVSVGAP